MNFLQLEKSLLQFIQSKTNLMANQLFMIPCPIAEHEHVNLPLYVILQIHQIDHFIVERAKTARRFLKSLDHPTPLPEIHIEEMDKHNAYAADEVLKKWNSEGHQIGVISEAGCPGIADPGSKLVAMAHDMDMKVIPLVGPSSILLALMASGMNGQQFTFHGYLPNKNNGLAKKLKSLEKKAIQDKSAELFIETPYRNKAMLEEIIKSCHSNTKVSIALDITGENEYIKTMSVHNWMKQKDIFSEKRPAIFIIGY